MDHKEETEAGAKKQFSKRAAWGMASVFMAMGLMIWSLYSFIRQALGRTPVDRS